MTDSMNFGPDWIRNLSSEGSTGGGGSSGGTRYQLADFRYGREEMLALFDRNAKPPASLTNFKSLYSETGLLPLALLPTTEEERVWQGRPTTLSGPPRGRGGSLERGGRISRGRGGYQYGRASGYESGWGNGEQPDWSPRKEYNQRTMSVDNWRRARNNDDDDGWRNVSQGRSGLYGNWDLTKSFLFGSQLFQKGRSTSWRGEGDAEERSGPPERGGRPNWQDQNRGPPSRRSWDCEDHLPEWATENPAEGGGTFDERGAFHGSDDELEGKPPNKREIGLQKSTSQQQITTSRIQHSSLSSSKSTMSLIHKSEDTSKKVEGPPQETNDDTQPSTENTVPIERKKSVPNIPERVDKEVIVQERAKSEGPPKPSEKQPVITNGPVQDMQRADESDFERLQEDFVLKLVVDEEPPKQNSGNFDVAGLQPPPNLVPPTHEKWFYQDPQGQMQGPFANIEMAEWYKAGYFSNQLKVRRQCDERFFLLGELITMCSGANPFQAAIRFPTLKNDVTKMPDPDILQFQYLSQMAAYKEAQARILAEPWSAITLQQQELAAQRLIMQQQQVPQDLQYIQQPPPTNPLMHMINQMQQANKLPAQGLVDKQPQNISPIDPHLQMHMGNLLSLQNRIPPTPGIPNHMQTQMPSNLSGSLPPETLSTSMPSLQTNSMNPGGISLSGMQANIPVSLGGGMNIPRPTSHGSVDQLNTPQDNDPISNLLKQLQQKQQTQQVDSLWQQNQYSVPNSAPPQQWQSQQEVPLSMWDIQQSNTASPPTVQSDNKQQIQPSKQKTEKEKEQQRMKEESSAKELKKKKEQDEKQVKKDAEERRKQEQRKQDAEKKAADEKKKKDEERVKKELEKARKEAEEKRLRELEEKRRLKEQRKAEEESRKKSEETRKLEDDRLRKEAKEMEARRQAEERRIQQEQIRTSKAAPWSQPNSALDMSLADIQKAEREKRAHETALQVQRLQEKEYQHQQQQQEKPTGIQLNWAKKPVEPRKVKSLAEIQAEEHEILTKQAAESRLQKEKEAPPVTNNASSIWNSQSLTWASASATNSQWSSLNNSGGFWDDSSHKQTPSKPSTVSKSNSTNSVNVAHKQQQAQKQQVKVNKIKKEDSSKTNHNNNNNAPSSDEFTNWCYKTLSNITTSVDIPTFVTFLRDIESAFDVREYCKEYLGDSTATQQFATNFLEKRRSFKPKNNAHKDDMCSPAPAITPSLQHSTEFQEVKGKNKKNKKSKMLKVDARILGFNVTSAPDRINVGDRDYGDNS